MTLVMQVGMVWYLSQCMETKTTMTTMTISEDVLATDAMEIVTIQIAEHHGQMEINMTMTMTMATTMTIRTQINIK